MTQKDSNRITTGTSIIGNNMMMLLQMVELGGETGDTDVDSLLTTFFADGAGDFQDAMQECGHALDRLSAQASALRQRAAKIQERARRLDVAQQKMREYIQLKLDELGYESFATPDFVFTVQPTGNGRVCVRDDKLQLLLEMAPGLFKSSFVLSKTAAAQALKEGHEFVDPETNEPLLWKEAPARVLHVK